MGNDISLHFSRNSNECVIKLNAQLTDSAQTQSGSSVRLNGRNYVLQGAASDLQWLKDQFPELEGPNDISLNALEAKLNHLGAQNIRHEIDGKVSMFAIEKLSSQPPPQTGHVIIVGGHSTAGKTTIINAIMKLDPQQNELGIDLTAPRSMYDYLESNHSKFGVSTEDWKHLHDVQIPREENYHIHDAVDDGLFQFRNGISEQDQAQAKKTAEKLRDPLRKFIETLPHSSILVVNKAHEISGKGNNVIMDTVNLDALNNHSLGNQETTKVLVYCKLAALSDRLKHRNQEALDSGHLENIRAGTFPIHQYLEVFGAKKAGDKEEDVIDTISRETVERVIDEQFDAGIQDMRRRNPQQYSQKVNDGSIAIEKKEEKEKLLAAFGFTPSDPMHKTVQLTPRNQWTMKIDTTTSSSSDDVAKKILETSRGERSNSRKRKGSSLGLEVK